MKIVELKVIKSSFKLRLTLYLFLIMFLIQKAEGQTQNFYDSLDLAKSRLNEGQIPAALNLLQLLEKSYPGEENVIRLKGQALYWSKDFAMTKSYFRQSIQFYPSLTWIKLDFGRILFEMGEFMESEDVLQQFILLQPENPEALQKLAEINYWTGGKPNDSFNKLNKILEEYPENESAQKLKREIQRNTAPRFGVQSRYYSDTQIMEYFGFHGSGEFYHSALLQPSFLAEYRNYQNNTTVFIAQATLKSSIIKTGTDIYFRVGTANSTLWESRLFTYGTQFSQQLPAKLKLTASVDREYYLFTLASISQAIHPITFRSSFGRETGKTWIGKLQYERNLFEDNNWVQTIAAWFLIPVIQSNDFYLGIGSSLNFSDSKEIRFSENLPIKNQIGNTEIQSVIPGSYNPYFTPINQQIAGALAKLKWDITPALSFSLTGNFGFYAQIDNPNMVYFGTPPGQGNGQGNRPISADDIYLVLIDQEFTPIDFNASIDWKISQKTSLITSYNYQKTIFFHSNLLNFGLKTSIWNE